jgi:hypothetical protein
MRIIAVMTMRNESDVLEAWIRYYAALVDHIIILDNSSADNSCEIALELQKMGLPVTLDHDDRVGHLQPIRMTSLMRRAVRDFDADWVLLLDADELLVPPPNKNLHECLSGLDQNKALQVAWRTYIPKPEVSKETNPFKRLDHRLSSEVITFYKVMVPKSVAKHHRTRVKMGNHSLKTSRSHSKIQQAPHGMFLAHYPVRSIDQLKTKILVGWLASLCSHTHKKGQNSHWKELYDQVVTREKGLKDITELSIGYLGELKDGEESPELVCDSVAPKLLDFPLNCTIQQVSDPLEIFARTAEDTAEMYGQLAKRMEKFKRNPYASFCLFLSSILRRVGLVREK